MLKLHFQVHLSHVWEIIVLMCLAPYLIHKRQKQLGEISIFLYIFSNTPKSQNKERPRLTALVRNDELIPMYSHMEALAQQ